MKKVLLSLSLILVSLFLFAQSSISTSYNTYHKILPSEKSYIHSDRTFYNPGEDIWFRIHLVDASNKPSNISEIITVELINPRGSVEQSLKIQSFQDAHYGNFTLGQNAAGGLYKLKAYTNWQKNFGEEQLFSKEITVQKVVLPRLLMKVDYEKEAYGAGDNVLLALDVRSLSDKALANTDFEAIISIAGKKLEKINGKTDASGAANIQFNLPNNLNSQDGLVNVLIPYQGRQESISRSIPIVLNDVAVTFFPEGGDLLASVNNSIAFKAVNTLGKPADIQGIIIDENNNEVTQIASFHQGMGAFNFTPKKNTSYALKITSPAKIAKSYPLPKANAKGINFQVNTLEKNKIKASIYTLEKQSVTLAAIIAGKIQFTQTYELNIGKNEITLPTENMPVGICQLTLFDAKLKPRAERLVFVNKHRKLNITFSTDKKQYLPREWATLDISIKDETDKGVQGNFSLAVVDDNLHTFADDKQDNILSYLLMSSELKGEIAEPNFYFDENEEKATQALDLVMMTHGWRRFDWEDLLSASEKEIAERIEFEPDLRLIRGRVLADGKPVKGAKVYTEDKKILVKTDKNGRFTIKNVATPVRLYASYRLFKSSLYANYYSTEAPISTEPIIAFADGIDADKMLLAEEAVELEVLEVEEVEEEPLIADNKERVNKKDLELDGMGDFEALDDEFADFAPMEEDGVQLLDEVVVMARPEPKKNALNARVAGVAAGVDIAVARAEAPAIGFAMEKPIRALNMYMLQENISYNAYHAPRQFYVPNYPREVAPVSQRTDFRKTIYWNPNLSTDANGNAQVSFTTSDEVTTFRAILEGTSKKDQVIHAEHTFFSQMPLSLDVKIPAYASFGDSLMIPVIVTNNTNQTLAANIMANVPINLFPANASTKTIEVAANTTEIIYFKYYVNDAAGDFPVTFTLKSTLGDDEIKQVITVKPKGFPRVASVSGNQLEESANFIIKDLVPNSQSGRLIVYPNILEELISGVESIFREPYGCFEQVSSSNYPNIMALNYMQEQRILKPEIRDKALKYLSSGYSKLVAYETSQGGFEWFGNTPPHEALTAYGLLQFTDMKAVYDGVDDNMIARTAAWLQGRADGKGGYSVQKGGYDGFRGAGNYYEVSNAYIVYALASTGYSNIENELETASKEAQESLDVYRLSLVCLAYDALGRSKEASELRKLIYSEVKRDGFDKLAVQNTITQSYGDYKYTEAASLAILAILNDKNADLGLLSEGVNFLAQKRGNYGSFGSTQATVLALKALTAFAKFSGKVKSPGTIKVYAANQLIAEHSYKKDHQGAIEFDLTKYISEGANDFSLAFENTKEALPYSMDLSWSTFTPNSSKDCRVDIATKISSKSSKVGETVRLSATIKNKHKNEIPTPIALIGIPSGLSLQPWQLKELKEKGVFDYYEIQGNYLVAYFTEIAKDTTKEINLDLKADIPGTFLAPASSAYLYYDNHSKDWEAGESIVITP